MKKHLHYQHANGSFTSLLPVGSGVIISVIAALVLAETASAQVDWKDPDDGLFSDGANWVGGDPPTSTQTIRFNTGANPLYTVSFNDDAESGAALINGGSVVRWDLGGNTYDLDVPTTDSALTVGDSSTGSLEITNGTINSTSRIIRLGTGGSGSRGTLLLSGSGTVYNVGSSGTDPIVVGNATASVGNESLLRIENGAILNANRLHAGVGSGQRGALEIVGANSLLTTNHQVNIGGYGHGSMTVSNGGEWKQTGFTTFVSQATSHDGSGRLRVDNGIVSLQNLTFGQKGVFDAVLHTGGFDPLVSLTGATSTLTLTTGIHGTATLELSLAPGFTSNLGDVFTLFRHNSVNNIAFNIDGQFLYDGSPITHGSKISVGGYQFEVGITTVPGGSYTLTTIPEPGSLVLVVMAGILALIIRFRRSPKETVG